MKTKHITTVRLWDDDVQFLKELAAKNRVPYQQIVRNVLSDYVESQKKNQIVAS